MEGVVAVRKCTRMRRAGFRDGVSKMYQPYTFDKKRTKQNNEASPKEMIAIQVPPGAKL